MVLDIETFARRAERVYSRATLERKVKVLRMYDEFLERSGLEPGPESLATWLDSLRVKPQSLAVYARDVLSYFNIMMLDVDERKVRQVKSMIPPITFKQPEILTVDEVRRLLEVSNYPHKVAFALAYAYARRLSEVLACEVDLKSNMVTFPIAKRRAGERVTFNLEDWIRDLVLECIGVGKCGRRRLFKITGRAVEIAFKKALARAGIKPNDRRLRVHSLRHSRVSHLVEAGVPLEVVGKTLAYHVNISTTYQFYVAPTKIMQSRIVPAGDMLWRRS